MAKNTVITERYREPGCYVSVFRDGRNSNPEILALLRGGLGDIRSSSMGTIAHKTVRKSDGEIAVGIVRTTRPLLLHDAIYQSIHARKTRAESMEQAIIGGVARYRPKILITAGQSQGGITTLDGNRRHLRHKQHSMVAKAVLTIDMPGLHGPLEYDGPLPLGLLKLGIHCLAEVADMSVHDRARLVTDYVRRGASPFELLHILGEVSYLRDIDASGDVTYLEERGVPTWHMLHNRDIIPGAELAEGLENMSVHDGGHAKVVHGEGAREAAGVIVHIATRMQTNLGAAA